MRGGREAKDFIPANIINNLPVGVIISKREYLFYPPSPVLDPQKWRGGRGAWEERGKAGGRGRPTTEYRIQHPPRRDQAPTPYTLHQQLPTSYLLLALHKACGSFFAVSL